MEIVNTIEFFVKNVSDSEGGIKIDEIFATNRLEAYKKMFPDIDCIGWYSSTLGGDSTQDCPSIPDAIVHKKMQKFTENPLYLIMNNES